MRLIHNHFRLGSKTLAAAAAVASVATGCGDDDGGPGFDLDSGVAVDSGTTTDDTTTDDTTTDNGTTTDDSTTTDDPDGGGLTDGAMARSVVDMIADDPDLSTAHDLLVETGLDEVLEGDGPFTIFLPTNDAFELLPDGLLDSLSNEQTTFIMSYHMLSGAVRADDIVDGSSVDTLLADNELRLNAGTDGVFVNGLTQVTAADIEADNGVIHEVDSVLIPGPFPGTLVDVLAAYPRLSTLSAAIEDADLGEALAEDDLTLFAPVNSAFEGVTLPDDDDEVANTLSYHAWPENASAEDIVDLATARAVSGAFMVIETTGDSVAINDGTESSEVIYTDFSVLVTEGGAGATLHLIDRVLQPPADIATVLEAEGRSVFVDGLDNDVPGGTLSYGEQLNDGEAYTVFAPTNGAFSGFPLTYPDEADLMGAHIVVGAVDSAAVATAIADGATLETLTGADDNELALSAVDDVVRINAMVQVTGVNIPASNGIVHLVDSVILPSDLVYPGDIVELLEAYPVFSTLLGAVGGLTDNAIATALTLNADKTLFAPFNPAFEGVTLPDEPELVTTLGYHLLSGSAVDENAVVTNFAAPGTVEMTLGGEALVDGSALTINNVNIIRTDIRTDDGIIHVLDEVLEPGADVVPPDAGAPDSGTPDSDSGTPDAGAPDASAADAGQ